ncbi:hypothetical protein [Georgenia daeguensis]|uniref:Oligosaccharide flippase family protein n=1 Tax=Georgenia daeguensis TaxID=908355 RepID=A0ABP8ES98_9MICO
MVKAEESLTRRLVSTGLSRIGLLPVSVGATLLAQGLAIDAVGVTQFGVISLVTTMPQLLTFLDFGIGTALINGFARGDRPSARRQTRVALAILGIVAFLVLLTGVALQLTVGWRKLLGSDIFLYGYWPPLLFLLMFACSIPFGLGARILTGLGRVALATILQTIFPLMNLACAIAGYFGSQPGLFIIGPACAQLAVAILTFVVATRIAGFKGNTSLSPTFGTAADRLGIFQTAWPMLITMMGVPVALQSHRIALSHMASAEALGVYAVAMVFYAPAMSLVNQVLSNLWPHFAGIASKQGEFVANTHFWSIFRKSAFMLVLYAAVFFVLAPVGVQVLSEVSVPRHLWAAMAVLILIQGLQAVPGMYLTDARGLRFQAVSVSLMCLTALALMLVLTPMMGAVGPVLSSVLAVILAQLIPELLLLGPFMRWKRARQ